MAEKNQEVEDFDCDCCGETYDGSLKFVGYIITKGNVKEDYSNPVCPDCLSMWFVESPEDILEIHMKRMEGK